MEVEVVAAVEVAAEVAEVELVASAESAGVADTVPPAWGLVSFLEQPERGVEAVGAGGGTDLALVPEVWVAAAAGGTGSAPAPGAAAPGAAPAAKPTYPPP